MPARRMRQNSENKERFRQLIKEKVAREKEKMKGRIDEELPSWAAWALKPIAGVMFDVQRAGDNAKGEGGEDSAFLNLWLMLPRDWIVLNDVVLEPKPDEFIQLDHVLIGPPGIYLVETKAWDGAFLAHKDNWKRKQGNRWVRCESPTRQSLRHLRLFTVWILDGLGAELPMDPSEWIHPNVLFTRAKWLKAESCSVPVFQGATAFAWHIRKQTKKAALSPGMVDSIARSIAEAGPYKQQAAEAANTVLLELPAETGINGENQAGSAAGTEDAPGPVAEAGEVLASSVRIEEGRTKQGRVYVKVYGTKEDALKVHQEYQERGRQPTACMADRFVKGAWYFYIENL